MGQIHMYVNELVNETPLGFEPAGKKAEHHPWWETGCQTLYAFATEGTKTQEPNTTDAVHQYFLNVVSAAQCGAAEL